MNSKILFVIFALVFLSLAAIALSVSKSSSQYVTTSNEMAKAEAEIGKADTDIAQLREQVKKLETLVPDQAAIMTKVGYHFTNMWFAVEQENWPLADFYLGETRANVKWAVRSKPFRKGPNGENVDLGGIADALDKGQFTELKKAIDAKEKPRFTAVFDETLSVCYSCHKASGKPYLRPQRPASPEVRIINLDPNAKTPQ